jgi:hypothetical protein
MCATVERFDWQTAVKGRESELTRLDPIAQLELYWLVTTGSVSWRHPVPQRITFPPAYDSKPVPDKSDSGGLRGPVRRDSGR